MTTHHVFDYIKEVNDLSDVANPGHRRVHGVIE